ncbi:MAG: hypothetical protein ACK5QC_06105 [Bacteroidota bacterium]
MSSHFNYEIDEKSLRQKLLNYSSPLDNDAWQRFETHRNQKPKSSSIESAFKNIQFGINKSVVLPLVFGTVIIAFSYLLYNFISINTTKKKAELEIKTSKMANYASNKLSHKNIKITAAPVKKDTILQDSLSIAANPSLTATPTVELVASTKSTTPEIKTETKTELTLANTNSPVKKISIPSGESLYPSPSIKTSPIATTSNKITYYQISETVYFLKLEYTQNGELKQGYFRKSSFENKSTPSTAKKKTKAETLESAPMPSLIGNQEEKEIELR